MTGWRGEHTRHVAAMVRRVAEPQLSAAGCARLGGGGIDEVEASAVFGGGGIDERAASAVRGGGGMAEHDSAVLGGGGIFDPERTGFFAPVTPPAPASITLWCAAPPPRDKRLARPSRFSWSLLQGSSDVQTTTRVRSPRNRSLANSSGSPERA